MSAMPPQQPITFNFGFSFTTFAEHLETNRQRRQENADGVLTYGVDFLDRCLGGIFPRDLVLVGADSGIGKTQFVSNVAAVNARRAPYGLGKRVHGFFLEADEGEIQDRIKWRLLSDVIFDDIRRGTLPASTKERLSYQDWQGGLISDLTDRYESGCDKVLAAEYANLFTCYKVRDFTADDLEKAILSVQTQTDLIILDHLHYLDSDDPNENRGYKTIVKRIREVQRQVRKPVIVVVHVRKPDGRISRLVPRLADIHGTSDIPKIATRAIMLARGPSDATVQPHLVPTLIAPLKNRIEGARTFQIGRCMFNRRTNTYEEHFDLGRVKIEKGEEHFDFMKVADYPHWARDGYESPAARAIARAKVQAEKPRPARNAATTAILEAAQ